MTALNSPWSAPMDLSRSKTGSQITVFNAQTDPSRHRARSDPCSIPRFFRQHAGFVNMARARARRGRSRSVAYQQVVNLRMTSSATQIRVPTEGWTPLPVAAPKLRRRSPPALTVTVTAPPLSPPPPSPPPSTCRIPKHSRRVRTRTGHSIAASCQREHPARRETGQ